MFCPPSGTEKSISSWTIIIFKKIEMATSQGRFKWTDDKPINLIKCLKELDSSYVKFAFLNIDSFQWLQGFEVTIVINIKLLKNYKFQFFVAAILV